MYFPIENNYVAFSLIENIDMSWHVSGNWI